MIAGHHRERSANMSLSKKTPTLGKKNDLQREHHLPIWPYLSSSPWLHWLPNMDKVENAKLPIGTTKKSQNELPCSKLQGIKVKTNLTALILLWGVPAYLYTSLQSPNLPSRLQSPHNIRQSKIPHPTMFSLPTASS
ncbi:MAG: hypothetical protein DDT19_02386 [Syntrophomonadaceae bacterium]|nr:hypothetical protein [Bacillota bacterium]